MRLADLRSNGLLAWILPIALAIYLIATQDAGYSGLPYWLCLAAPAVAVLAPWLIVAALPQGRPDEAAGQPARIVLATAGLVAIAALVAAMALRPVSFAGIDKTAGAIVGLGGLVSIGLGVAAGRKYRGGPTPTHVLLTLALITMVAADLQIVGHGVLRDLGVYLRTGHSFLDGQPVYAMTTSAQYSSDSSMYPFVYPPPSVPLFGVLAALPVSIVRRVWVVLLLGVSLAAIRMLGVRWRWVAVLLLWPPFVQGIAVGNVIGLTFAFFAAAPLAGSLLALPPFFKGQLGVTGLWLVRERRWRDLALAVAIGAAVLLITLPMVGIDIWRAWAKQLSGFLDLLKHDPPVMGFALSRWLSSWLATAIGVAVLVAALTRRRGDGLAALGVGSLAAAPTLYPDGVTMGLPALLRLRAPLLWLALALTSTLALQGSYWVGLGLGFAALWIPALTHARSPDPAFHPLGSEPQAWPTLVGASQPAASSAPTARPKASPKAAGG
jgi:hypothetical protein